MPVNFKLLLSGVLLQTKLTSECYNIKVSIVSLHWLLVTIDLFMNISFLIWNVVEENKTKPNPTNSITVRQIN